MAEFHTTTGVSHQIEQIIKGATEKLVLVSPYLRVNDRFRQLLEEKDRFKIDIRLIYGKQELSPDEIKWISELKSIRTSYCKNLHAKCYYNESRGIVTSMNLYQFSEVNNQEIGISFSASSDPDLFQAMKSEIEMLLRSSEEISLSVQKVAKEDKKTEAPRPQSKPAPNIIVKAVSAVKSAILDQGHCIRCRAPLPHDIAHPYCRTCYGKWMKEGGDELLPEKYCHWCGKENKGTFEKPVCYDCYKKHLKPKGN